MITTQPERDLIVELVSKETFRQFLRFREMSYGQLAKKVGCSKALIGHLVTGERKRTGGDIAKSICKNLDIPVEALFLPDMSTVYEATSNSRNRSATEKHNKKAS